jgi:hypothetical protein
MVHGQMRGDDTSRLIENLIHNRFAKLAVTADGWEALYQDPQDDRFWELTFPQGEMQGGGPRVLRVLSIEAARLKYGLPS